MIFKFNKFDFLFCFENNVAVSNEAENAQSDRNSASMFIPKKIPYVKKSNIYNFYSNTAYKTAKHWKLSKQLFIKDR